MKNKNIIGAKFVTLILENLSKKEIFVLVEILSKDLCVQFLKINFLKFESIKNQLKLHKSYHPLFNKSSI